MNVSKITIGRLYNLGDYEHIRYELTVEIPHGESPATAIIGMEKILSALNPKTPGGVPDEADTKRETQRLAEMRSMDDELFERYHRGHKGTRAEYTQFLSDKIAEGTKRREQWLARSAKARKLLEDLGGAANWKDAKLDWENEDF
jgi:hypothetical protein